MIQSDGIDIEIMRKMCGSLEAAGFSAENITYGMGGGLLQKVGGLSQRATWVYLG